LKHLSKVALITGSATGIGRACAIEFASLGFDVVVNYPDADREEAEETVQLVESHGSKALLIRCDVSNNNQVVEMIRQVEERFGRLDVVVNCAGVTHFVEPTDLEGMTEEKWDEILAVNTKGPFFVTRAAVPLLKKGSASAVVNISSAAGAAGFGSSIAYCASKGALNTLTKSLAQALAPKIRVNAVCPGPIDSRWLRVGMTEEEIQDRVSNLPIPKIITPEDIANTVAYLAVGTSKTTGQLLTVDCGRSM
jgi:3-oxoacyl-[acyl-carrier protein] reductase